MGKFNMGPAPFKKDVTPVYEVPFDHPGLVAKANKNGTIIVNKDKVWNKPLMKEAIAHEKHHIKDMMKGDLDYDGDAVYFKGKKYKRGTFDEANENLPWEKEAYKAGREGKEEDLTPNKIKLDFKIDIKGDGGVKSPISFKKMGNKWASQDKDSETVSMNEDFGMGMYGPGAYEGTLGGESHPEETEEERKKRLEKEKAEQQKKLNQQVEIEDSEVQQPENKVESDKPGYDKYEVSKSKKGPLTDKEKEWKENYIAKYGREAYDELVAKNKKTLYVKQPTETSEPNVKIPETPNLATLLNEYRIKNNVDMTYYDPEKPGGRGRHTPESYMRENPGFKAFVEAQKRKALQTGNSVVDDAIYDDTLPGKNYTKGKNPDSDWNNTQIGNPGMFTKTKMY